MKKFLQRAIALVLALCMLPVAMPKTFSAQAADTDTYTLENDNIQVTVSTKNGGFFVRTKDGDVFNKDDDNKDLLFHNDQYDTSFTSFQVTRKGVTKEYIFGGNYSFLGLGDNTLNVTEENGGIVSTWSIDDLTFTQTIQPVESEGANEHGTVAIYYTVENAGADATVKARLLLDTTLGDQDFGYYELAQSAGGYNRIETEQIVDGADIPDNFFAYDDYDNPTITAFTVNDTSSGGLMPYQAAFGHWNDLASTAFDFTPDTDLNFTNTYNKAYLTADSAYALYYDLGTVSSSGEAKDFLTYYGVYSNASMDAEDKFSVNITAPSSLELNGDKDTYIGSSGQADGKLTVTTNITNLTTADAQAYSDVAVVAYADTGFDPLDSNGVSAGATYSSPYLVNVGDFAVGRTVQLTWDFASEVYSAPSYRKITFKVYNMPDGAGGDLLLENLIGSASTYVYCPGGDGTLPSITFTDASPDIVYCEGTRHLYLAGSGFDMLQDTSRYALKVYSKSTGTAQYTIPGDDINFTADSDGNTTIDVVMTETMTPGDYYLVFEWGANQNPAGIDSELTAPALDFSVSDDKSYKNDYYGIVAVVKTGSGNKSAYDVYTFSGEVGLNAFKDGELKTLGGEILVELRGDFIVEKDGSGNIQSCSAVTVSDTDTITINGVLDVTNGDVKLVQASSDSQNYIYIDMEGEILTSYSRTAVWDGVAHLTPLIDGDEVGLIAYDDTGERKTGDEYDMDSILALQWSSEYQILQTIGGMAVDLRYGEFGKMYNDDGNIKGYVLSFGASLDVSSLMPGGSDDDDSSSVPIEEAYAQKHTNERSAQIALNTCNQAKADAEKENEENKTKPVGKVNIEDILYGLNSGYLGVNAEVELTLPQYVDALPELEGDLTVNTINGYSFEVNGGVDLDTFEMEFELRVQSAPDSGAPVPDKIYFHVSGFEPGYNVDNAGVLWLTGGGGGIDNLYDTIFSTGIPPLTLLLTADFDIVKVMSAQADLSLSLRGFKVKLDEVKLKNTNVAVLNSAQVAMEWDPDFYLLISASVDLLDIISGGAYIVVDNDFFEFFLRVGVKIPKAIPLVGGMTLAQADLGANNDRIWGALTLLQLKLGICYYWGGDFSFGTGDDTVQPTYPDLLGIEDIPVSYDEDTGQTLYMRIGTNITQAAAAQVVNDLNEPGLILMGTDPSVLSNAARTEHRLNLGDTDTGDDFAFSISFANGGPQTIEEAQNTITIQKPDGSGGYADYDLTYYDGTNAATANANLIYDADTGKSSVNVTITDYVAGDWKITTSSAADIILYNVATLPEVSSLTASQSGNDLTLNWSGSKLDETEINVYVTDDISDGDESLGDLGTYIGSVTSPAAESGTATFTLPADLQSGTYYVRMLVSEENEVNDLYLAKNGSGNNFSFTYTNANQPGELSGVSIENAGNLMFDVGITNNQAETKYDGYLVNVYEQTGTGWSLTDLAGLTFETDDISVGGSFTDTDGNNFGLTAGKTYRVGVSAYKNVDDGSGNEYMVLGEEAYSDPAVLNTPDPPEIGFVPDAAYVSLDRTVDTSDSGEQLISVPTFTTNDVEFTLTTDQPIVSGKWYIDGMTPKQVANVTTDGLTVAQYLPDGDHTITFSGTNAQGDNFLFTKLFSVDTTPPRLMLTSPVSGSYFNDDGTLTVSGITDPNAIFTVLVDGQTAINQKTLAQMGYTLASDGTFSFDLPVDPSAVSHKIEISVKDTAGNQADYTATVKNRGLADIESLEVMVDGVSYSTDNIQLSEDSVTTASLSLLATTGGGSEFVIDSGDLVLWETDTAEGSATVDQDGNLTVEPDSVGLAVARFQVSETADMTAAVTFGAEAYHQTSLTLAATTGGSVTGGGNYLTGDVVQITATPNSGYRFDGWSSSSGGSFADASAASTTFTMPEGDTVVTAKFVHIASESYTNSGSSESSGISEVQAEAGQIISVSIPASLSGEANQLVPYYVKDGENYLVSVSVAADGKLVFLAPEDATYDFELAEPNFSDTAGHWGADYIDFAAARGLFRGVGSGQFDPNGGMTRAMFITVLSRLESGDLSSFADAGFTDVASDAWYWQAVNWAVANGIASGVGGGKFDPDADITREQMALILCNYLQYKGYQLPDDDSGTAFADADSVSDWALDAVSAAQEWGILQGKSGNLFDPLGTATRAEGCTVLFRLIRMIVGLSAS